MYCGTEGLKVSIYTFIPPPRFSGDGDMDYRIFINLILLFFVLHVFITISTANLRKHTCDGDTKISLFPASLLSLTV